MNGTGRFDAVAVRLGALGDVALTTGVLAHWGRARGLRFAVLTRERFAPLFDRHPAVTEVIGVSEEKLQGEWFSTANTLARTFGHLPLIDLHGVGRTLLLASMWKGPYKKYPKLSFMRRLYRLTGLRLAASRLLDCNVPQRYALALDDAPPPAAALLPVIDVSEEERTKAGEFLDSARLRRPGRPLVALHPYATHPNKAWPEARWQELVSLLEAADTDYIVIGVNRRPFLKERAGDRDLTNGSSLRATLALLGACDACVTGDSGPMHLAAGVGTPVVALFGPTTRHWGFFPAGPRDVVLERSVRCRPCDVHGGSTCRRGLACLTEITALDAAESLAQILRD